MEAMPAEDLYLVDLIKAAATRRKMKRYGGLAGGIAVAAALAGGSAWQQKHPRGPKGRFRTKPDKVGAQPNPNGSAGRSPQSPKSAAVSPVQRQADIDRANLAEANRLLSEIEGKADLLRVTDFETPVNFPTRRRGARGPKLRRRQ